MSATQSYPLLIRQRYDVMRMHIRQEKVYQDPPGLWQVQIIEFRGGNSVFVGILSELQIVFGNVRAALTPSR